MATAVGGDLDHADALCEETLEACRERGDRWNAAWAFYVLGVTAGARGRTAEALDHSRDGLRLHQIFHSLTGLAMLLDLHSQLLAAVGAAERAAIVDGATDQIWQAVGRRRFGSAALNARHDQTIARIRADIGDHGYDVGYRLGAGFSIDATIGYALTDHTEPVRTTADAPPETAESPLTPREREVADLVAQGLSNRQIAARLITSHRTTETHVENILRKLGFTSRTQIATWITAQRRGP